MRNSLIGVDCVLGTIMIIWKAHMVIWLTINQLFLMATNVHIFVFIDIFAAISLLQISLSCANFEENKLVYKSFSHFFQQKINMH